MNRRQFIQGTLAAGAASIFLPSCVNSGKRKSINGTIQVGLIGAGRMGRGDMQNAMAAGTKTGVDARIVAVCDVDSNRAQLGKLKAEQFYLGQGELKVKVDAYTDFRDLLARKDIDAVIISTPEHWHALIGIAAANAGKHIYLQKPLTYSIPEGKALVKAVRENGVTLQTGSQQRSSVYFRQVCTMIRNQWLGELKSIEVEVPTDKGTAMAVATSVPGNLNYDMWLGPRFIEPYVEAGVHPQADFSRPGWLQREQYCLGMITGWGSHMYDIAQWAMGTDVDSGPVEVFARGDFPDRGLYDVHVGYEGEAVYENGVRVVSRNGNPGVKFITENGWAYCARGQSDCSDKQLLRRKPTDSEVNLYHSQNHMADFLSSARIGKDPICPVEVGHRSNTICVLHHASMKLDGRKIRWDPSKQVVVGDNEVSRNLELPMRDPWSV